MSRLVRVLILAVVVAVLPLAGMTAVAHAQANDQDTPSQQELAERWNTDYYQATHMSPAQHKAWLQANAAQRALSDRQADYSHATQMSPAELKAWMQARDRAGTPTAKTHQVPAPVQPDQPSGQPLWLVVALGMLAAALAVVAGLALLAARRANRRAQVGHAT
jgi:Na+(H+)/acetate symporter ActP